MLLGLALPWVGALTIAFGCHVLFPCTFHPCSLATLSHSNFYPLSCLLCRRRRSRQQRRQRQPAARRQGPHPSSWLRSRQPLRMQRCARLRVTPLFLCFVWLCSCFVAACKPARMAAFNHLDCVVTFWTAVAAV